MQWFLMGHMQIKILLGVTQNSKWVTENVLCLLNREPPNPPQITSMHKIFIFIFPTFLKFILSLHFLFVVLKIHLENLFKLYDKIYICYVVILLLISKILNVNCKSTFLLKRKAQLKNVQLTQPLHNIIEHRRGRLVMIDRIDR